MSNNQQKKKDYIGVTVVKGHTLKFYYIGGSRIGIEHDSGKLQTTNKKTFEEMARKRQVKITDEERWREICAQIRPDGSTKTHNADGSPKSAMQQTMTDLIDNNIVSKNSDGTFRITTDDDKPKTVKAPETARRKAESILNNPSPVPTGVMSGEKNANNGNGAAMAAGVAASAMDASGGSSFGDGEFDGDDDAYDESVQEDYDQGDGRRKPPVSDARLRREKRLKADMNGDGVVDEFDDLVNDEQKKNGFVMVVFFGAIIVSVFLFFFIHSVTAMLLHGEKFDLFPSGGEAPIEQVQQDADGASDATSDQNAQGDSQQQGTVSPTGDIETVTRTDFDPETAVINYPMANVDDERMATTLIKMIKEDINNGDVKSFNEAVDIEAIAGQIAPEYAFSAKELQNLTDAQTQDLMVYYHQTFRDNERTHVINKDPYASIFGGRIREVRKDPYDVNKLYVVMESITGDHQRICFTMQGDGSGNWIINGITDPGGYVRMIQKGVVE